MKAAATTRTKPLRFDLDRFVADCRAALLEGSPQKAVREVVARAMSEPGAVLAALGEPRRAVLEKLHHADDLTILHMVWAPHMVILPHDHRMWAVIGLYTGREDNVFWRRLPGDEHRIEAAGAQALSAGDAAPLGRDIIHSVMNPIDRLTGAIHVYGGDFFHSERSEWDPGSLRERPFSFEKNIRLFEEANARL